MERLMISLLTDFKTLRKHVSTLAQIMHIEAEPMQWLLNHMGHTEEVHRLYYRQQSDILEKTKVAKLLYLAENGLMGKYYGKTLDDICESDIDIDSITSVKQSGQSSSGTSVKQSGQSSSGTCDMDIVSKAVY